MPNIKIPLNETRMYEGLCLHVLYAVEHSIKDVVYVVEFMYSKFFIQKG